MKSKLVKIIFSIFTPWITWYDARKENARDMMHVNRMLSNQIINSGEIIQ